jgi:hypothetical protein
MLIKGLMFVWRGCGFKTLYAGRYVVMTFIDSYSNTMTQSSFTIHNNRTLYMADPLVLSTSLVSFRITKFLFTYVGSDLGRNPPFFRISDFSPTGLISRNITNLRLRRNFLMLGQHNGTLVGQCSIRRTHSKKQNPKNTKNKSTKI